NKKPIIYPGHKIFIEPADIHSQEVQDIIETYNNYHAAIDYDRRMRAEYKAEIIARRHPGFQQNKEEKNIQETLDSKSHKIVYGETLSHVAVKYSTTVYDLQKENNIADPSKISIGQIIKIPSINKNLLSYKKNLVLSEAEKKQKFYSEVKNALEYNPIALDNLIAFLQENITDVNTLEVISQTSPKMYLMGLLYSLNDTQLRDSFVNTIKHPDTYAQDIIPKLASRKKYNQCGK
ncbi:MAG: LysM peptidoglycan-binding domain-containing protein, partial [Patescibacteria group bacterium]